jgi:hypothetical protein
MNGLNDFLRVLAVAPQAYASVDAAFGCLPSKSFNTLREEVRRWRDESRQDYSDDECEHLVAWLNRNFYRL